MAGLLYFLPGRDRSIKLPDVKAAGLDYAFEDRCTPAGVERGPDGERGVIVADDERIEAHRIGYYPDKQTWRRIPGLDAWVGMYTDDPPEPTDLIRQRALPGHWVRLGDGHDWLIPVARAAAEQDSTLVWYQALPQATTIDEEGRWIQGGVLPAYQRLWDIAMRWWDAVVAAETIEESETSAKIELDFEEINDGALLALATNYRVGKAEVALLGLFDDQCVREILAALIDMPTIQAWLKKKAAAAGSSIVGGR